MIALLPLAFLAAPSELPPVPVPQLALPEPMRVEIARDVITGSVSAFAIADGEKGRLAIGCDPDEYRGVRVKLSGRAWIAPEDLATGAHIMRVRFDAYPARRMRFVTGARTAELRPVSHTENFIQWVLASRRVAVRFEDVEGREVDYVMPLAGARPALAQMLTICRAPRIEALVLAPSAQ